MHRFLCPHCSMSLRIRDRSFVGRQIECPDCGGPIQILANGPNELEIRKVELAGVAPTSARAAEQRRRGLAFFDRSPADSPSIRHPRVGDATAGSSEFAMQSGRALWWKRVASPIGISWLVAGSIAAVLLLLALWPERSETETGVVHRLADADLEELNAQNVNGREPGRAADAGEAGIADDETEKPSQQPANGPGSSDRNPASPASRKSLTAESDPAANVQIDEQADIDEPGDPVADLPRSPFADLKTVEAPQPAVPQSTSDDVATKLDVRIVRFEQAVAVQAADVLADLEQMADITLRVAESDRGAIENALTQQVTFDLNRTTLRKVLDTIANRVGIDYRIEADGVWLYPASQPKTSP